MILGGDLNTLPYQPGPGRLLQPARAGRARLVPGGGRHPDRPYCRCGRPTYTPAPRKIDYVFANRRFFPPRAAATAVSRYSDHRILIGEFYLL